MREIKFRAWEKREKRMIYADEVKNDKSLLAVGFHGLPIAVNSGSFKDDEIIGWNIDHRLELMQYTGIKDYKGQEIYEGDILRLGYSDGSLYGKPVEVKFGLHRVGYDSDVMAGATALGFYFSPYPCTEEDEREVPIGIGETFNWDNENIEVIGNVYEHPRLLGAKS